MKLVNAVEYYTFDAGRYCNDTAKAFYRSMASVGVRTLFRQATGQRKQRHIIAGQIAQMQSITNYSEESDR